MADLAVKTVRSRLATVLEAESGWTESAYAFEFFGRDVEARLHQCFAIGVPSSEAHAGDGRQKLSEGCYLESEVRVAWAYELRGDAQVSDYDLALDAEQTAVKALLTASRSDLHVNLVGMERRSVPEFGVLGTITLRALQRYALQ